MCGRYSLYHDGVELRTRFFLSTAYELHMQKRYNITPGSEVVVVTNTRTPEFMKWGLIPSWAMDLKIGFQMMNARSETIAEKPAFRSAFRKRRCFIPVSGWYEWRKNEDGSKTPFYFQRKDRELLALAGIWETWTPPEGDEVRSAAIITTAADPRFKDIHDRMPAVLLSIDEWLREDLDLERARSILAAPDVEDIESFAVSKLVNRPAVDSPECIRPA